METFYFLCDFLNTVMQIWFVLQLVGIQARSWLEGRKGKEFRYGGLGILLLFPVMVCMICFYNIYLLYDSEQVLLHWRLIVQGSLLLCVLVWMYVEKRKTEQEARMQKMKIELLESNYLSLRQVVDEKELMLHDMKNHMYTLRDILVRTDIAEAKEYVEGIIGKLKESVNLVWTHHQILDLILNRKLQEARETGVSIHFECDDMEELKLSAVELCALFTNLLDNAVEANMRCPEGMERKLDLECRRRENMLIVTIWNRITEEAARKGMSILEGTEKVGRGHGYGMRSIRRVVDAYRGDFDVDISGGMICIRVSLPAFKEGNDNEDAD